MSAHIEGGDRTKLRYFVGAIGAAAVLAATPSVAADAVTVKIGSFTPPKAKYLREIIVPFLRTVEKDSGEEVQFKEFWGGALIRSPRKQWEGVMNKIQDAAQVLPAYTPKLFPDFTIFAIPYTFRDTGSAEAAVTIWKMYEQGHLGGLEKVHVFGVYTNDNSGMHLNRKISSLADIEGLKFRVAQGLGEAMMEQSVYDPASGQALAGSFMDYAMPRAVDLPSFHTGISEVPTRDNPLGIRSGGEGGTTPSLAAYVNAVVDALAEFGVEHLEMPVGPESVRRAIGAARADA